jgi:hypothetical protein
MSTPMMGTDKPDRHADMARERPQPKRVIPDGWTRGELLISQVFAAGCLLYRSSQPDNRDNIQFPNTAEANDFVGWWYAPMAVRMTEQA